MQLRTKLSPTLVIAASAFVVVLLAIGCGEEKAGESPGLPARNVRDGDGGAGSGEVGTSSSSADCTNHAKVDDRPACDQCTRSKCCASILKCDETADCKALQQCLEPCSSDDIACVLLCQAQHPSGNDALSNVGACAGTECKAECPLAIPDAGFDAF